MEGAEQPNVTYLNKAARRQLTVLFCDLVGSTEISEKLDIEDWCEFLRIYQSHCQKIIKQYDGHIAQYLGDGLLVYFGYPVAYEDSAHSAVAAGLEILEHSGEMEAEIRSTINAGQEHVKVEMRTAIHTGPVIVEGVGEQKAQDYMALGVVPAIAARLQDKAKPNSVIISEATHALIHASFECESLGNVSLKGVSGQQQAYRVSSDRGVNTRFEAACETGLTPFISRDEEVAFLQRAWQEVKSGSGRLVLVGGDPGIGKSRLTKEFSERCSEDECFKLSCQCSAYHKDSALYPLISLIQNLLGFSQQDSEDEKLDKIQANIDAFAFLQSETLPLIAGLLSVSFKYKYPGLKFPSKLNKQELQAFYSQWIIQQANGKPIYLLVEDYHWVDPSTDDFLRHLVSSMVDLNMLLVITHRPEASPHWQNNEHILKLSLGPLPSHSVESMIRKMWGDKALSSTVIDQLIESTDGVPLFIEESIIMLLNQLGLEENLSNKLVIPTTLQDLLLARLDRVGEAKHVAQLAATIGREFDYDLLAAISPYEQQALQDHLNQLIASGLLCVVDGSDESQLFFKHALIRDIAYQSLLISQTRTIHKQLSVALCEHFPDYKRTQPEIIAYHLTRAASYLEAIEYWKLAGRRAIGLHAHLEAVAHLEEALKLIERLPEDNERKRTELELNTLLGGRMIVTQGYGADKVEIYYSRALQLAEEFEDLPLTQKIMFGLEGYHFIRGDFTVARQHLDKCLLIATKLGDTASILKVNWSLGEVYFHLGDQQRCQFYLQRCLQLYDEVQHNSKVLQDPGVMSHIYMSWSKWMSGFPDQSMQSVNAAKSLAEELDHPFSKAIVYCMLGGVNLFRGEYEQSWQHADISIKLCEERGFQAWLAYALAVRGRALVSLGEWEQGIAEIREGLQMWEESGAMVTRPYYRALLAESLEIAGRPEEALAEIVSGLEIANITGEEYYQTEILRMRGVLTHNGAKGDEGKMLEAQAYVQQAIELARKQGAKSFELRAELSMAKLQKSKADPVHSHPSLAAVYNWFDEGIGTQDLLQAGQILGIAR